MEKEERPVLLDPEPRAPDGKIRLIITGDFDGLDQGYDFPSQAELEQFLKEGCEERQGCWIAVFDCSGTEVPLGA